MIKPHRRRKPQQDHNERLLRVLQANLAGAREPGLRERLTRALRLLQETRKAA
jgi:hypothetical protein